jgi:predicted membrane protein
MFCVFYFGSRCGWCFSSVFLGSCRVAFIYSSLFILRSFPYVELPSFLIHLNIFYLVLLTFVVRVLLVVVCILYDTILYYTILYYTTLYYTILYYTTLYYTILYYTTLHYTIVTQETQHRQQGLINQDDTLQPGELWLQKLVRQDQNFEVGKETRQHNIRKRTWNKKEE